MGGERKSIGATKLGKQAGSRQAVSSIRRVGSLKQFKNHVVRKSDLDLARSCHLDKLLAYLGNRSTRRRIVHGRVVGRVEVYSNPAHSASLSVQGSKKTVIQTVDQKVADSTASRNGFPFPIMPFYRWT